MKKVYLAGGISDIARKEYQRNMARKIRLAGAYEVYAAAENDSINDKSNNPTPLDIYNADISALRSSDMFIQTISGGNEDGTNYESGVIAGINEERVRFRETLDKVVGIIACNLPYIGIQNSLLLPILFSKNLDCDSCIL